MYYLKRSSIFDQQSFAISRTSSGVAGFTLFELLIVLVIIGLISALVLPKVGGNFGGLKLKTETKKVAAALRYARSQAVSENLTIQVRFDLEGGRINVVPDVNKSKDNYPWTVQFPPDKEAEAAEADAASFVQYELTLVDSVKLSFSEAAMPETDTPIQIVFFPSGGSSGGTVFIETDEKRRYRIIVDDILGTVKVLEDFEHAVI